MSVAVNYTWYVARLREEGSFHTAAENLPVEVGEFRRDLRRAMKAEGFKLQTSLRSGVFLAWDPDYVVPDERLREVVDRMADQMPPLPTHCPSCGKRTEKTGRAWKCPSCGISVLPKS